jgi:hypothetical protein
MKLDPMQRMERKWFRLELEEMGGFICRHKWQGLVAAAVPAINSENSYFVRIAVAQCDFKDDRYKRKYGEWLAMKRLFDENRFVSVPLNGRSIDETVGDFMGVFE